jgi:transposase InsO family protein
MIPSHEASRGLSAVIFARLDRAAAPSHVEASRRPVRAHQACARPHRGLYFLGPRKTYRTRDEAKADVFDYIERFYNAKRRHSTLGYLSPRSSK